jgi:hypothetical protein
MAFDTLLGGYNESEPTSDYVDPLLIAARSAEPRPVKQFSKEEQQILDAINKDTGKPPTFAEIYNRWLVNENLPWQNKIQGTETDLTQLKVDKNGYIVPTSLNPLWSWSTGADTQAQKVALDKRYTDAVDAYNKANGTNIQVDKSVLGATTQPNQVYRAADSGGFADTFKSIALPVGLALATGGVGSALGASLGIGAGAGTALAGAGLGALQGQDLGQIATNAAIGGAAGALGSTVGAGTESQLAGRLAGGTTAGLLRGQDLGTALTGSALNTGANAAAGGLMNVFNTPSSAADYSTGANYDLTQGQNTGGLGLKADLASFDPSNPYSFNTNFGNQDSMGGGTGIQVPTQEGATLGSIGTTTEAATSNTNPATQNLISKLLLAGITGNTGTNNMATNNNLLGSLLGGGLTAAGGLMQGSTTAEAQKAQADALRQAGQLASSQAQFRPVGTTTTFGTSNFQVDPTTGQLTSAGYSLSPQMQAYQNQIMGAGQQSLTDAANLQNLGRGYIAQTPEQAAQKYMTNQQALLAPSRDLESARLANQLQQTGRTGVSVAQGGALGMANPEQQALANARAMQDLQLAAQAQQAGQQQVNFGQGLLSSAYQPFNAGLSTASNVEQLGQNPLAISSGLAQQSAASGARAGQLQLGANEAASKAALGAANYNPFATALSGLGGSSLFGSALGNLAGSTSLGSSLGNWLGSLGGSTNDYWTGSPNGVDTSNIDYNYLSNIYANNNPFAGVLGKNETWTGE